jgi:hypothetical protein
MKLKKLLICAILGIGTINFAQAQCIGLDDLELVCKPIGFSEGSSSENPCPIKICIVQRVDCLGSDGQMITCFSPFAPSQEPNEDPQGCKTIHHIHGSPDQYDKLCFYKIPSLGYGETGGPCRVVTESVSITRVSEDGSGQIINLSPDDAQLFMDIISGVAMPGVELNVGTFGPCGDSDGQYWSLKLYSNPDWANLYLSKIL